jgi:putative OPT family oligopeptide transporter
VLFTIPLRRALVTTSDLPYPEGVAAAEVLKVGSQLHETTAGAGASTAREGLFAIMFGAVASAGLAAFTATRIAAGELQSFFRLGTDSATGYNLAFSLALLGAGHLVGISVGLAMLTGLLIAWAVAIPILTSLQPDPTAAVEAHVMHVWTTQVRFMGAGAMAVAALWTLARLAHPLVSGFARTIAASRAAEAASGDQTDRDLSGQTIVGLTVVCLVLITGLVWNFTRDTPLADAAFGLTAAALPFVVIAGFLVAAICGYMAGLIGSSNSPVSGVGILAIVTCSAMVLLIAPPTDASAPALVAFALFVTTIVFGVAVTSNDNLQDLKTGQLVGAAPLASAGRSHRRHHCRRACDSADPQSAFAGLWFRRRAERSDDHRKTPACAAGEPDLDARAGRDRPQARLEHDRPRHADWRRHRRARRISGIPQVDAAAAACGRHGNLPADVRRPCR